MTAAYPLSWPLKQPRTDRFRRARHTFRDKSMATVLDALDRELAQLKATDAVLSSNVRLRLDGTPRSGEPVPDDPGVALYFKRKGAPFVLACDAYTTPEHNAHAIALHLNAMRSMERWKVGSLDQLFTGYAALPAPDAAKSWRDVLQFGRDEKPTPADVVKRYRDLAKVTHPDAGGSREAFVALGKAYEEALAFLGV